MTKNTISLRLNENDSQLFRAYAKAHGISLTDLIRSAVLEKIEDAHDLAELREALINPDMVYYTHDDVKKELGFD